MVFAASDPSVPWSQLGAGATVAVPMAAAVIALWRQNLRDRASALARERELSDRALPLLAEAVRVLSDTPRQFDRALNASQGTLEVDRVLGELKDTLRDLDRRRDDR